MRITLTDLRLMTRFLKRKPLKNPGKELAVYAEAFINNLTAENDLKILSELKIDVFETIFVNGKPFSSFIEKKLSGINIIPLKREIASCLLINCAVKGKKLSVCRLSNEKGYYEFLIPEPVTIVIPESTSDDREMIRIRRRIRKSGENEKHVNPLKESAKIKKIQSYLIKINSGYLSELVKGAEKNFDFTLRFNNEMFHQNITWLRRGISKEEVTGLYETDRFMKIIDLSDIRERIAFIALYGITFKGLDIYDFYSIGGIFSPQSNRERDSLKQLAGNEVFDLVIGEQKEKIYSCAVKMGYSLRTLELIKVELNNFKTLGENYSLYCGLHDIGRCFARIILPFEDKDFEYGVKIAGKLSEYRHIEKLFSYLGKNSGDPDLFRHELYWDASKLENMIGDKKTAGELCE